MDAYFTHALAAEHQRSLREYAERERLVRQARVVRRRQTGQAHAIRAWWQSRAAGRQVTAPAGVAVIG